MEEGRKGAQSPGTSCSADNWQPTLTTSSRRGKKKAKRGRFALRLEKTEYEDENEHENDWGGGGEAKGSLVPWLGSLVQLTTGNRH
jgi:hypothetical protein